MLKIKISDHEKGVIINFGYCYLILFRFRISHHNFKTIKAIKHEESNRYWRHFFQMQRSRQNEGMV